MKKFAAILLFLFSTTLYAQTIKSNAVLISKGESLESIVAKAANVVPSPRQLQWQKMEFIAFIHFGTNTFTNREWGEGNEPESVFNPTDFDAKQIVKVCKEAGIKMLIITAKHHDGLCLWQTEFTTHSINNSPWKNGKGDVVKELSDACKAANIKFGVYLSPWDRHEKTYGDSPAYNNYFRNQLNELLTKYGEISEVWFDGACGEGKNGKKQIYDWESYYQLIRKLQPNSVISIMGPDARWVGTEEGYGRNTEWSVVPVELLNQDKIAENSQQKDAVSGFIPGDMTKEDLGSRDKIKNASKLVWYPSEVDVSIRPGWFYHQSEDNSVKTPEKLFDIYLNSVGKNSLLLLNIPPDKTGKINAADIKSLKGFKQLIDNTFSDNLAKDAIVKIDGKTMMDQSKLITDNDYDSFWMADEKDSTDEIVLELNQKIIFNTAVLQENINIGQRVEAFKLYVWKDEKWEEIQNATTIGYKRILNFPIVTTDKIKLKIEKSRLNPSLSFFGIYKMPPEIRINPEIGCFTKALKVSIESEENTRIFYTLNGKDPDEKSQIYTMPLLIKNSCNLKVMAVSKEGKKSLYKTANYTKTDKGLILHTAYSPKYSGGGDLALLDG
ncbi:MAG: alpha-L-fucosidase, partial [Bacteroidales bacterium]